MKRLDCIIIGAGPAGLGCAAALAEHSISCLLIEKNVVGTTAHSWIIWNDFLERNDLTDTIRNSLEHLTFRSFLGSEYHLKVPISASVHEDKILTRLAERIKQSGGIINQQEEFISYRRIENGLAIKTTSGEYTCGLLIDAGGNSSRIQRGMGYSAQHAMGMGCFGYDLYNISSKHSNEALIFDAFFPGNEYFWYIPYSHDSAFAGVFFFQPMGEISFKNPAKILHDYIRINGLQGSIAKTRFGVIPLIPKPFLRRDKILFIGDTASSPLPSSGFGFVRSFEDGMLCARFIARYLDNKIDINQYEQCMYEARYPGYEMHYLISNILINLNDELLFKAIYNMNNLPDEYIAHFLKGDDLSLKFILQSLMHIRSTFTLQEIRGMAIKQNYKEMMLRLFSVYPRITIPILKRELQSLFREIKEKLPKDILKR